MYQRLVVLLIEIITKLTLKRSFLYNNS